LKVFAWKPEVMKWLFDEKQLLSGISLTNIPVSCVAQDAHLTTALSQYSGIQKIKVQENTKVTHQSPGFRNVFQFGLLSEKIM